MIKRQLVKDPTNINTLRLDLYPSINLQDDHLYSEANLEESQDLDVPDQSDVGDEGVDQMQPQIQFTIR